MLPMPEVWAPPGPMYMTCQYAEDAENMTYVTTAKKTTNVLTTKETMALVLEIVRYVSLVVWVLWHINLCRLFNAKSIFMQIVLFQTILFRISTQFKYEKYF